MKPKHGIRAALSAIAAAVLVTGLLVVGLSAVVTAPAAVAAAPTVVTITQATTGTTLSADVARAVVRGVRPRAARLHLRQPRRLSQDPGLLGHPDRRQHRRPDLLDLYRRDAAVLVDRHHHPGRSHRAQHAGQGEGWKVILGVNLKQYDPARAADEAKHAVAALGSSLQAIEIGNEPDLYSQYSGNTTQYLTDFQAYVSAITAAAPGVPIEGTDADRRADGSLQNAFVDGAGGPRRRRISPS